MKLITLKFTNIDPTEAINNYVEDKIAPLEKYLAEVGSPHNLFVELAKETRHHKKGLVFYAEADIVIPKAHLRASAEAEDLYAAIDLLHDEIKSQLKKHKDKTNKKRKDGARKAKRILVEGE
ncbi:MAG: ribosome-associated translation inhibitor RaiA [Patescibacteria group bacterium]